jgi:hypothetical protein
MKTASERKRMSLVGAWILDRADTSALAELGDVMLEFDSLGGLVYTVRGKGKDQVVLLRYRVDGATIITDRPSAPKAERTKFSLSKDGVLTLAIDGVPRQFRRW